MTIPFLDLKSAYIELKDEIDKAALAVLNGGLYVGGQEVLSFEHDLAKFCSAKYAVGVGNGLDALVLSLKALGVGPEDEVIVPSNTFIATWLAVSSVGAIPVSVEPREDTFNMDPDLVEAAINDRTKAVIIVHLFGQPADLRAIKEICLKNGLFLVEDAAQCIGAKYWAERIGSHGDVTCWSFYPGKNLGAVGDAGAITTNSEHLANKIRQIANYGSSVKYVHNELGCNSRLDTVQAAILRVKLRYLDAWNQRRQALAKKFLESIDHSEVILPTVPDWAEPVWHLFVVKCQRRDELQRFLFEKGVQTLIHYPVPPHRQGAYQGGGFRKSDPSLTIADQLSQQILSIPMGPHVSHQSTAIVVDAINNFK